MAGHPKPLGGVGWGGGMVLEWVEQTEVCCEGSCRLDTLILPPSSLGPAASHPQPQLTVRTSLDRAGRLFHDSRLSLTRLCFQKCLSFLGPCYLVNIYAA